MDDTIGIKDKGRGALGAPSLQTVDKIGRKLKDATDFVYSLIYSSLRSQPTIWAILQAHRFW